MYSVVFVLFFFFFQAEDGIRDLTCDWSSDVCSSDLELELLRRQAFLLAEAALGKDRPLDLHLGRIDTVGQLNRRPPRDPPLVDFHRNIRERLTAFDLDRKSVV